MNYYKFEWDEELHKQSGVVYEVFAEFCKNNPEAFPENFEFDDGIILEHYCCDDGEFDEDDNPTDLELLYGEIYYVQDAWWEDVEREEEERKYQEYLSYPEYKISWTDPNEFFTDGSLCGSVVRHFKEESELEEYLNWLRETHNTVKCERV